LEQIVPPPFCLALTYLRIARGWSQATLARAAKTSGPKICEYERRSLSRDTLERLVALMGYTADDIDLSLLYLAGLRGAAAPAAVTAVDPTPAEELCVRATAAHSGLVQAGRVRTHLQDLLRHRHAAAARREASAHWEQLRDSAAALQLRWVDQRPDGGGWAFAETLCTQSSQAAADDPNRALHLAQLALRVAHKAGGDPPWRACLEGYCRAFVANALRARGDVGGADAEFTAARNLWQSGGMSGRGPLAEWQMLDMELSLRLALRQFDAAHDLFRRALPVAPPERRGHLLLRHSLTLEYSGEIEAALATLDQATPLVDADSDVRNRLVLRFNRLALFCRLGRYDQANAGLPEVRRLASQLRNRADNLRLRWLAGRVAAGLGKEQQARRDFEKVRDEFAKDRNAYGCALVSLDLAILHLERGRDPEVAELAQEMMWVFASQRIHREALAALRLFVAAAESGIATVEQAAGLVQVLERSRQDRRLQLQDAS
jgi:tetratricopeptide (TPR) repeat protein